MGLTAALSAAAVAASVGGAIYSTSKQTSAANKAADIQQQSVSDSNALQKSMFDKTQENIKPYLDLSLGAGNKLFAGLSDPGPNGLLTPFNPTMQQLEQTPGFQFTRDQGLKAVNNANSAKGWGLSGAGLKSIADYTTGLASNTYQTQFGNWWAQKQAQYGMLYPSYQLGANSAVGQGQIGAGVANSMSQATIGGGNAGASAALAGGNAAANAPFNALLEYQTLKNLIGNNSSTSPTAATLFGANQPVPI